MRRRMANTSGVVPSVDLLLEGLNPEQAAAVQHYLGPQAVISGAGSGKTSVLVRRVAHLVVKYGIPGNRILATTFSKKAADEMNDRLQALLPGCHARVGTLHSIGLEFLRAEHPEMPIGESQGHWRVDGNGNRYTQCVKDATGWRGMDWKSADLTLVLRFIGLCKARCAPPDSDAAVELAEAFYKEAPCAQRNPGLLFQAYSKAEQLRKDRLVLTFDDMLLMMWEDLKRDASARARWAAKWDFFMQDEAQDENPVQGEIMEMLATPSRNYTVVGDPAQSVYSFRGSTASRLLGFVEKWGAKVVLMNRNYRCGRKIIDVANGVLRAMEKGTRMEMELVAERRVDGEVVQGQVRGRMYLDADHEAEGVVERIRQLHEDGVPYKDMAVLYRTNAQSRAVEEACLSDRIPYVVIGGTNFYDRREVKSLLAYLRIAAGRGTYDDVHRCINTPFRYLGAAFTASIERAVTGDAPGAKGRPRVVARPGEFRDGGIDWTRVVRGCADAALQQRQHTSALEWCGLVDYLTRVVSQGRQVVAQNPGAQVPPEARPASLLEHIIQTTQYTAWLTRDEGTESPENNRVSNVRELVRASERFPSVDELLRYVQETLDAAEAARTSNEQPERVTMMSIHRSKGLEWPVVFAIGLNDKVLPHARCEDEGEERRLAYVAFTRARDVLEASCMARGVVGDRVVQYQPSPFLAEAGIEMEVVGRSQGAYKGVQAGLGVQP